MTILPIHFNCREVKSIFYVLFINLYTLPNDEIVTLFHVSAYIYKEKHDRVGRARAPLPRNTIRPRRDIHAISPMTFTLYIHLNFVSNASD